MKRPTKTGKFGPVRSFLYRFSAEPALVPLHRRIAGEIPIEGGSLLDIGCGTGRVARRIAVAHPRVRVVGLEPSEALLRQAGQETALPNLEFQCGSIEESAFSEEFDFAISVLSFHHWEDPVAGLTGVHRALKAGGRLWIYENDPDAPADAIRGDRATLWGWFRFPIWWQRRIERNHGFLPTEVDEKLRPLVARSPFGDLRVTRTGSTLRLEMEKAPRGGLRGGEGVVA